MKLLLDDRYAPTTSNIGFFEADVDRAADAWLVWQHDITKPGGLAEQADRQLLQHAVSVVGSMPKLEAGEWGTQTVSGPLSRALDALLPLSLPATKRLFVPTASGWTAYFDNSTLGSDPDAALFMLPQRDRLGCRGLDVTAVPDTLGTKPPREAKGRFGACSFILHGPDVVGDTNIVRGVEVVNDGGRWTFDVEGAPLPFEEPEAYKVKRVRDRFPFELLDRYCRALGLRPFDEDFYLPPEQPNATLIERITATGPGDGGKLSPAHYRPGALDRVGGSGLRTGALGAGCASPGAGSSAVHLYAPTRIHSRLQATWTWGRRPVANSNDCVNGVRMTNVIAARHPAASSAQASSSAMRTMSRLSQIQS